MLEKLSISRFKSIRNQELSLGKVNLFIGGNGSGKSNILEAIGVASAALGRGLGDSDLSQKGIRLSPTELMKSAHKGTDNPKTFELVANFSCGVSYKCNLTSSAGDPLLRFHSESSTCDGVSQFGRSGNGQRVHKEVVPGILDKNRGIWDQIRVAFEFPEAMRTIFSEFGKFAIFTPQTDVLRGVISGPINVSPVGLHGEGLPRAVLDVIENSHGNRYVENAEKEHVQELELLANMALELAFLPGWTNSVRVGKIDPQLVSRGMASPSDDMVYFIDKFMKKGRNTLSAYDSSEGTLFLLFMAVLLAHPSAPRYFGLDNVDSALNPKLTRRLVETIIAQTKLVADREFPIGPKQVFLTSHNPTSLDAFDLFDDDVRVFVVNRDDAGRTNAVRLEPAPGMTREQWTTIQSGKNLSQMWLDGMIKGANGFDEM